MDYTKEQIQNKLGKLPPDIKEAINSLDTTKIVVEIGENNNLHIDQIGDLVDEVGLTMLGLKNYERFAENIMDRIEIDAEKAEKITAEINQKVFLNLRESIKKIHQEHSQEEEKEISKKPAETTNFIEEDFRPQEEYQKDLERNKILEEIENPEKMEQEEISFSGDDLPVGDIKDVENDFDMAEENSEITNDINEKQKEKVFDLDKDLNSGQTVKEAEREIEEIEKKQDIITDKLEKVTKNPPQEKEIKETGEKIADPYREPIE